VQCIHVWNDLILVGIVTASATANEAERNAASTHLSHFSEQTASAAAAGDVAATLQNSHRGTNTNVAQSVTAISNSRPSSSVITPTSTHIVNCTLLPATSTYTAAAADVSALLFDDQLLPELPPPLIPIPERYQPLVDVEMPESVGNKAAGLCDQHQDALVHKSLQPRSPKTGECSVCMEREPNAALYPCGHMCMCYECAISVQKLRGALCPICRQPIIDILRIYRT